MDDVFCQSFKDGIQLALVLGKVCLDFVEEVDTGIEIPRDEAGNGLYDEKPHHLVHDGPVG